MTAHAPQVDGPRPVESPACSAPGCDRPAPYRTAGLCIAHYHRVRRTGSVGDAPIRPAGVPASPCSVDGCDARAAWSTGLCRIHAERVRRYGTTDLLGGPAPMIGPDNPKWKGAAVRYGPAHERVARQRGPASTHRCVECGAPARHWALAEITPAVRFTPDDRVGPYSLDPADYAPMCVPCHKRHDLDRIRAAGGRLRRPAPGRRPADPDAPALFDAPSGNET